MFYLVMIMLFTTNNYSLFGEKKEVTPKSKASIQEKSNITESKPKNKTDVLSKLQDEKKILTVDEVKNIQRLLVKSQALSLNFEQKTYRSLRKKEQYHFGQIYLVGTGKFYWQVEPLSKSSSKTKQKKGAVKQKRKKDILIFDGNALFSFSEGSSYAIQYPATNSKGLELKQLVDMIMNFDSLLERYVIQEASQNKRDVSLTLIPKGKTETKKVKLVVELVDAGKVKSTKIKDLTLYFENDNYSTFKFSNHKEEKVDLSRLVLPKGLKVNKAL